MIRAKVRSKTSRRPKRLREGYDPPFLIYFKEGTLAALDAKYGLRGKATAIRKAVEQDLAK